MKLLVYGWRMIQSAMKSEPVSYPSAPSRGGGSRVDWVDLAKGICIILVVMMHTTLGLEKATGHSGWMHAVVEFARPFRMPDFFLISGLFLAATIDRPWRLYFDRKVVHFFYFYFLWVAIQFAVKAPFMMADGQSVGAIIRSLLFTIIQPFGTLWFIYLLPVFFIVTRLFRAFPWALFAGAVVLQILPINTTAILEVMTSRLGVISVDNYWLLIDEFCSFYVYFLAGYLCAPQIFKLAITAKQNVNLAIVGIAMWFTINLVLVSTGLSGLPVIALALGGIGAAAIVVIASLLTLMPLTKWLRHTGANSIVVYLAFFFPMIVMRLILQKFVPWLDPGTMAVVSIAVAVTTPLILYAMIERIGLGRFLFHRPGWAITANRQVGTKAQTKAVLQAAE